MLLHIGKTLDEKASVDINVKNIMLRHNSYTKRTKIYSAGARE